MKNSCATASDLLKRCILEEEEVEQCHRFLQTLLSISEDEFCVIRDFSYAVKGDTNLLRETIKKINLDQTLPVANNLNERNMLRALLLSNYDLKLQVKRLQIHF